MKARTLAILIFSCMTVGVDAADKNVHQAPSAPAQVTHPPQKVEPTQVTRSPQKVAPAQVTHPPQKVAPAQRQTTLRAPTLSRSSHVQTSTQPTSPHARLNEFLQASKKNTVKTQTLGQQQTTSSSSLPHQKRSNHEQRQQVTRAIRERRPDSHTWFRGDFFARHRYSPNFYQQGVDWWGATPWINLAPWLGWNVGYPTYYNENGSPIQVSDEGVEAFSSEPPNAEETTIVGDWRPIGVFSMGQDAMAAAEGNRILQLAVNKNGEIGGIYYNANTDQIVPILGLMDSASQKAVWKLANQSDYPIFETGVYNLTQDQTFVTVTFAKDIQYHWLLIRL